MKLYTVTFEDGTMKIFEDWSEAINFADAHTEECGMYTIEEEELT